MNQKSNYTKEELISCARGELFGVHGPLLPIDKMLMVDRITKIAVEGGKYNRGYIEAELEIVPNLWFFDCHFINDPVMPGCLGLDAMWQLVGFYLGWLGCHGKGRALGVKEVKFSGQVQPPQPSGSVHPQQGGTTLVRYQIDIKRVSSNQKFPRAVADGALFALPQDENVPIYTATSLKVGLIQNQ